MKKISVITSMYNRKIEIIKTIDKLFFPSLLKTATKNEMELIIIDDGSLLKKETSEMIEKYLPDLKSVFSQVTIRWNERNLGFARSFNRGISLAEGETVVLTNDDVFFPKNSIQRLAATLDEGYLMAGPITNSKLAWSFQYCQQAPLIKSYSNSEVTKLENFSDWLQTEMKGRIITTDNLYGFCFAADAKFLKDLGGFSERYLYGYFEDTDLIQRAMNRVGQNKIAINMEIFIHHGGIEGTATTIKQQPLKMAYHAVANSLKYGKTWGFRKLVSRCKFGLQSQFSGKGTISKIL